MESLDFLDRLARGAYRNIVRFDPVAAHSGDFITGSFLAIFRYRVIRVYVRCFESVLDSSIRPQQDEKSNYHCWIGDMEISALPYCFFHPVGKIAEGFRRS